MNIEEIEIDKTYNVRVQVIAKGKGGFGARTISPCGKGLGFETFNDSEAVAFSPVTDEPKYDPCRRFKAGDKVRIIQCKGRDFDAFAKDERGKTLEVQYDEAEHCNIRVCNSDGDEFNIDPAYLKLVIPAEELPYSVFYNSPSRAWEVRKANKATAVFYYGSASAYTENEAEALAQAECERLNAKHGK